MNPYIFMVAIFILAAGMIYGTYEKGQAESWHQKYSSLQASYASAALSAETHAKAVEAIQTAEIQAQSANAIQQAQSQAQQAQNQLKSYQAKLAAASKDKDLPHLCSAVQIPADLLPEQK